MDPYERNDPGELRNSEFVDDVPAGEAEEQTQAAGQPEGVDTGQLQASLEQAKAEAAEYLDNWRRAAAELSNARKRMLREQSEFAATAAARVLEKLIPITDDVDRAFENLPEDEAGADWVAGFRLIQRKLQALLESEGVSVIPTQGQKFDPALHHAVAHESQPGFDEGDVIAEVARGYKLGNRVLRPSMVRVAKGNE
jgi:molecular chaperone GrpE